MRKALFTLMALLAMLAAGAGLKAQEITITIEPGWNWISYPNAENMQIGEALGSFTPVEGDIIQSRFSSSKYTRGNWRGGLTNFVPGWGYKYYSARSEDVELVFAHAANASVATATPTGITPTSAVVGGMVMLPEGTHVFLRGVCWGTEPSPDIDGDHTTEGTGIGSFSNTLDGLNPNTTYYVRAYAVSDHGLAYGNELTFTTMSGIPVVSTAEITDITATTATCGGTVTDGGGLDITARGVCWSTSHNPTLNNNHTSDGTGTGSFGSSLITLSPGTTYYVRAYATTAQATSYGEEMTFTTMNGIPAVSTAEVTDITATTATCGGTVTTDGGLTVTARGVCWSTSHNPTLSNSHTTDGTGTGSFSRSLTSLTPNTTYYVRAYASNNYVTIYGSEVSFTTENGGGSDDHDYVDLGLPSGTLWATCNVGADAPEDYGDYFAWGETQPKDTYNWDTYQYCNGSYNTLTRYCNDSYYGYNGFTDNLTTLLPEDDAATANWGSDWRMPTYDEWSELISNTTMTWASWNGVDGRLFTASNGNSLFLPVAGYRFYSNLISAGNHGYYWSSSLYTDDPYMAWYFSFGSDNYGMDSYSRCSGQSVRAVRSVNNEHSHVDLGLPSGTLWATFNIGANAPEEYGDHFAWGEIQPKDYYDWNTYQHCNGDNDQLTKYCNNSSYGYNGFTDNLTTLLPEDDAATANWGSDWRMPTEVEWRELYNNTTVTWTTQNGVNGRLFTASNGNSLFLPAAGYYDGILYDAGSWGYYWSSTLHSDASDCAWLFDFASGGYAVDYFYRYYGLSIRAVRSVNGHSHVDLGLPSGTLWATCNIGANAPEEYGDYFAWGETQPKDYYDWSTYQYCNGDGDQLTKYCNNSSYGYNGFTDNLTTLLPEDDAATANWGNGWRMPTKEEWQELYNNTTCTWTTQNGVNGRLFTASNGNSLFLPAAGYRYESSLSGAGSGGQYWSSSLYTASPSVAWYLGFHSSYCGVNYYIRGYGRSVRAVRSSAQN